MRKNVVTQIRELLEKHTTEAFWQAIDVMNNYAESHDDEAAVRAWNTAHMQVYCG